MAFDNLLEDVCNDATVFFAMIQMLLYFNKISICVHKRYN
jgi:hypothetical protein